MEINPSDVQFLSGLKRRTPRFQLRAESRERVKLMPVNERLYAALTASASRPASFMSVSSEMGGWTRSVCGAKCRQPLLL